ncbi:hypothetical protein BDN70DRAFT_531116 [Pholiota conissans]|uniref:Uncharacterized protein n=1 Tax=Pholiota conissans TaxID=109636 RepID=A0A9P6CM15_9AGAR|nr:hypothetical protein BDN70DRAFT_531116 [Pholiota conissans]
MKPFTTFLLLSVSYFLANNLTKASIVPAIQPREEKDGSLDGRRVMSRAVVASPLLTGDDSSNLLTDAVQILGGQLSTQKIAENIVLIVTKAVSSAHDISFAAIPGLREKIYKRIQQGLVDYFEDVFGSTQDGLIPLDDRISQIIDFVLQTVYDLYRVEGVDISQTTADGIFSGTNYYLQQLAGAPLLSNTGTDAVVGTAKALVPPTMNFADFSKNTSRTLEDMNSENTDFPRSHISFFFVYKFFVFLYFLFRRYFFQQSLR